MAPDASEMSSDLQVAQVCASHVSSHARDGQCGAARVRQPHLHRLGRDDAVGLHVD